MPAFDAHEAAEHVLRPTKRFSMLAAGETFRFPGTQIVHIKLSGPWYRDGSSGHRFKTGAATAVVPVGGHTRQHAMKKADPFEAPIQFQHHGFTYRTNRDASVVEGHDGRKWNRTHSLAVRDAARAAIELRDVGERIGARGGSYKPPWLVEEGKKRGHATKKSAAQLDREIAEALGQFPFDEPELRAKWVVEPSDLRVGQRFDYFGKPYEITKIGRDKAKTVQIARRYKDPFGKEELIEHRSFPMRAFYQQHLRPLR